ncbi:MAG: hypothetical protein ACLFTK_12440 [Anaerolineales bacterium]
MRPEVYRPLGLTIAILGAVLLFGAWPLVKLYIVWRLNARVFEGDDLMLAGSTTPMDGYTYITGILGVVVILTSLFAWLGRPPVIRFVFQGAVLLAAVALVAEAITRASSQASSDVLREVLRCQAPIQVLMAVYIVWYCNRAPARAFYRQEPLPHYHNNQE